MTFPDPDKQRFAEIVATSFRSMTNAARDGRYTYSLLEQDIVPEARVYSVRFTPGRHVVTAYFAVVDDAWSVLTGNVAAFNAIASRAPRDLADPARARRYAGMADRWTTSWDHGQLELASVEDIPWNDWLDQKDQRIIEEIKARYTAVIGPESVALVDAVWTVATWVLASQKLLHRRLLVTRSTGALQRLDEVVAEALPVPFGHAWQMVDGRFVPVG